MLSEHMTTQVKTRPTQRAQMMWEVKETAEIDDK